MKTSNLLFLAVLLALFVITTGSYAQSSVVLNEIYSRGVTADPDWIEIYNPTAATIDITGFKIYDAGGNGGTKPKKLFPAGSTIPAKGFLVIVVDVSDSSGFGLSSSGEKVWLENASGVLIDTVTFPSYTTTQSYGRVPDGGAWQILNIITKGTSNGGSTAVTGNDALLIDFRLSQNYPNPFNPETVIAYQIPQAGNVQLKVFDVSGKEVAALVNEEKASGKYEVSFNASALSSGVYFYQLKAGKDVITKKLMLLK